MSGVRASARRWTGAASLAVTLAVSPACALESYGVERGIHYVTGASIRVHVTTPFARSLRSYRIIDLVPVRNLLPEQVSSPIETYLTSRLTSSLHSLASAPLVEPLGAPLDLDALPASPAAAPTMVFEGILDDYEPGYVGLRLAELGFNHVAVTMRVLLRDKRSGAVLGAASITAQDNRVTATTRGTIDRLVARVRMLVNAGYRG